MSITRCTAAAILWLAVVVGASAQTPAGKANTPEGPASVEMRRLAEEDQKDRAGLVQIRDGKQFFLAPTPEQERLMVQNDRKRRARVRELLGQDKLKTAEDFDHAALIFQHGETPDDYLAAHELSLVALQLGKFASMPAISEDRFLQSVGQTQRFGGQYTPAPSGKGYVLGPVVENTETAVTDGLRADFLIAPLETVRREGPNAFKVAMEPLFDRLIRHRDPKQQVEAAKRPESLDLKRRASGSATARMENATQALKLYHADKLETAEDYAVAASFIQYAPYADSALLAHELAAVAFVRGYAGAGRLAAETLDNYLVSIGQPQRYGTVRKDGEVVGQVSPTVTDALRARFGVAPLTQKTK